MMDDNNVIQMPNAISQDANALSTNASVSKTRYNNGDGGGTMKDDRYVTHTELKLNTEKVLHHMDNKFTDVDRHFAEVDKRFAEVDNQLDLLGQKIDQIPTTIENSILREREFQRQQHTETTRYIFGTIVIGGLIGGASLIVSIIGLFIGR